MTPLQEINAMYRNWAIDNHLSIRLVTHELAMAIHAEMERCEPFQYTKNSYNEDYHRCLFMIDLYHEAFKKYPITMKRAEIAYFNKSIFQQASCSHMRNS